MPIDLDRVKRLMKRLDNSYPEYVSYDDLAEEFRSARDENVIVRFDDVLIYCMDKGYIRQGDGAVWRATAKGIEALEKLREENKRIEQYCRSRLLLLLE